MPPLIHPLILPLSSHTVSLLYCIMFMYTLSINRLNKYQVYLISGRKCREANNFKVGRHSLGCVCARVVQGWYPATSQQIHLYISLAHLFLPPTPQHSFQFSNMSWQTLLWIFLWLICFGIFPVLFEKQTRIIQIILESLGQDSNSQFSSCKHMFWNFTVWIVNIR